MKEITLSNSERKALVDDDDFEYISSFGKWYENDSGYAIKKTRINGKNVSLRMHILVNKTPSGLHTDHINNNRLDNRKNNLRTTTAALNAWNKVERKTGRKYDLPRGITFDIQRRKYVARKVIFKRFDTKQEAINYMEGTEYEWK